MDTGCALERPGGLTITRRALEFCALAPDARIADIGCGRGETLRYLASRFQNVCGVDKLELHGGGQKFVRADAAKLPFEDGSFDCLLYECSFSKTNEPEAVLAEARRVLTARGRIVVSDFYTTACERVCTGVLGRVESRGHIESRLSDAGFSVILFEDYSDKLRESWGQLIFDYGVEEMRNLLGTNCAINDMNLRYGLFISEVCSR